MSLCVIDRNWYVSLMFFAIHAYRQPTNTVEETNHSRKLELPYPYRGQGAVSCSEVSVIQGRFASLHGLNLLAHMGSFGDGMIIVVNVLKLTALSGCVPFLRTEGTKSLPSCDHCIAYHSTLFVVHSKARHSPLSSPCLL